MDRSAKALLFIGVILIAANWAFAGATGSILGQVTDAKTGIELSNADVFVVGTKKRAVTDENGYFVLENVPVGTYTLKVTLIGYKALEKTEIIVGLGHTTIQGFILERNPPGKITGRVTDDQTGVGLPSAELVLVGTKMCAVTDWDGKFSFEIVPVGTYSLDAKAVNYKRSVVKGIRVAQGQTTVKNLKLELHVLSDVLIHKIK